MDQNLTFNESSQELMYKIGTGLKVYIQPTIIVMGVMCNFLSFLVMVQRHNRKLSCCLYMGTLAVSDTVFLITFGYYVYHTGIQPRKMEMVECMVIVYLYMSTSFYGVMIILSVTVDRFIAVCIPLKKKAWCTMRRARWTVAILLVIIILYKIPYLLYSKPVSQDRLCGPLGVRNDFTLAYSIFNFCLSCIIPFSALIVLNSCMIHKIRQREQSINTSRSNPSLRSSSVDSNASMSSKKSQSSLRSTIENSTREGQLTTMLISVSFALLILTAPQYIRHVIYQITDMRADSSMYGSYILLNNLTNTPFYLNNAINFWLYAIRGAKFRQDLYNLFMCKFQLCYIRRKRKVKFTI